MTYKFSMNIYDQRFHMQIFNKNLKLIRLFIDRLLESAINLNTYKSFSRIIT